MNGPNPLFFFISAEFFENKSALLLSYPFQSKKHEPRLLG